MDTLYDQLWDAVSKVRDASPRAVNDASTDDVVEAVLVALAGLRTRTDKAEAAIERVRKLCRDSTRADLLSIEVVDVLRALDGQED